MQTLMGGSVLIFGKDLLFSPAHARCSTLEFVKTILLMTNLREIISLVNFNVMNYFILHF
jgi:hypothetical protein